MVAARRRYAMRALKISDDMPFELTPKTFLALATLLVAATGWAVHQTIAVQGHTDDIAEIKTTIKTLATDAQKQQVYLARMASGIDYLAGGRRGAQPAPASSLPALSP